jgi:DUF1680 family protein
MRKSTADLLPYRLSLIAALGLWLGLPLCAQAQPKPIIPDAIPKIAVPFGLDEVQLLPGIEKTKQDENFAYLLSLDPDRFLYNFRFAAGLPNTAQPYGGWESPKGFCRGHFTGHYLSACAEAYAVTGDKRFKDKCDQLVSGLAECQNAFGNGFLFTAKPIVFENLLHGTRIPPGEPSEIVPFYTVHKIMAGLLDAYRYTGNVQAFKVACGIADYFGKALAACTPEELERAFHTSSFGPHNEFGGMSEVMHDLYAYSGRPEYLQTAHVFDRDWFLDPLSKNQDILAGLHANCHVPQVLGAARDYELTGNVRSQAAVANFWHLVVPSRTYNDGGSSGLFTPDPKKTPYGEHWSPPGCLEQSLGPRMSESCVAHNLLKLTARMFTWRPDPVFAAYYERTYFNTVLGTLSHEQGRYLYSLPLLPNSHKDFGQPENTFWCCYGTGVEAFSQLANPIYFHSNDALWVNLYVPSELNWKERNLRLTQRTDFPFADSSSLTVHTPQPIELALHLFVPPWTQNPTVLVNGKPLAADITPNAFTNLRRTWHDGDTVTITLPMHLRTERLEPTSKDVAVFYGPVMLAALTPPPSKPVAGPGPATATAPPPPSPIPATPIDTLLDHFQSQPTGDKLTFEATFGEAKFSYTPLFLIDDGKTYYTPFVESPLP